MFLTLFFVHLLQAKAFETENGVETPESEEEIEKLEEQALSLRKVSFFCTLYIIFYRNETMLLQFLVSISLRFQP